VHSGEPYEWTDEVPEDDPEFQGLLDENEDPAVYPDISAELPGVALEEQEREFQTITEEPEPEFQDFAEAALHNAGIDADEALRRAHLGTALDGPAIIDAEDDKIVYELTFDLPDAGLPPADGDAAVVLGDDRNDNTAAVIPVDTTAKGAATGRRYPTRACRSAVGIQPYDTYAPRTTFLQLGTARAHRSVQESRAEGNDAAPYHGHVDSDGCRQAVTGAENESTLLAALPEGEMNGRHQREGVHKRGASACIYPEGRHGFTYCINEIDVNYRDYCSKGGKESEVLRCTQRICQHGRGRGRHNGTERRTCRHDDPVCAGGVQEVRDGG
jgi:hypothetical protein